MSSEEEETPSSSKLLDEAEGKVFLGGEKRGRKKNHVFWFLLLGVFVGQKKEELWKRKTLEFVGNSLAFEQTLVLPFFLTGSVP